MKARGAVRCCCLVLSLLLLLLLLDRIGPRKHTRLHTLCVGYSSNDKIRIVLTDV